MRCRGQHFRCCQEITDLNTSTHTTWSPPVTVILVLSLTHQHIANHNTTATLNATVTLSNACLLMLFLALSLLHPVTFTHYHPPGNTQIAFTLLWTSNMKCMYTVPLYAASTDSSHFKY